jgi:MipA family protein
MRKTLLMVGMVAAFVPQVVRAQSLNNLFVDNVFSDTTDLVGDVMDTLMPGVTNVRIGIGPAVSTKYEGSKAYQVKAVPLISLRYKNILQIDNNQVRINLFGDQNTLFQATNFRAGPMIKVDFGRSAKNSPNLTGLGNVGTSIELGGFVSYANGPFRYRLRARHDVTSGHSGLVADADVSLAIYRTRTTSVGGKLGTTWVNGKYMNSYFGVTPAQSAASKLPVYVAGSGVKNINLSLGSEVKLSPRWALVMDGGYHRLLGNAKNSPLVRLRGSANQFSFGAYGVYSF